MMSLIDLASRVIEKNGGLKFLWATIGRTPDRRTVACTAVPVNPRTLSHLKHGIPHSSRTGGLRRRAVPLHPGDQKTGSHQDHARAVASRRTTAAACSAGRA